MNRHLDPIDLDHSRHEPSDWSPSDDAILASDYYAIRCEHCIVGGANDYVDGPATPDAVGFCAHCGENVCWDCHDAPCGIRMTCSCGRIHEGSNIHWVDSNPRCDSCDPKVQCDECGCMARNHEIEKVWSRRHEDWFDVCGECRGEDTCEDCVREDAKEVK